MTVVSSLRMVVYASTFYIPTQFPYLYLMHRRNNVAITALLVHLGDLGVCRRFWFTSSVNRASAQS